MAVLEVIKMGNPQLRLTSSDVEIENINTPSFQTFIDDLIDTMEHNNGAGIAAPQVARMDRVFTMKMEKNIRYLDKESFPLYVAINPLISFIDTEQLDSWEGCLSIPGIRGKLRRFKRILLSAYDREGVYFEEVLEGFAAVVAQHELDHLDGILLIDRMENLETLSFQDEYEKYWIKDDQ